MEPSDADRAAGLREAARLVAECAPSDEGWQLRHRTDILRRLGLLLAAVKPNPGEQAACKRCRRVFAFSAAWYARRGMETPKHCPSCCALRRQARDERQAASSESA
jgi:hypothetical protein